MKASLSRFFFDEGIEAFGVLPYEACRVTNPALLSRRVAFSPRSVIVFLIPYYAGPSDNLSLYAVSRDYHLYMEGLFVRLTEYLRAESPEGEFCAFADHSPIDERHAAVTAGLGMYGDNGLLIHSKYGSLVFIGEMFSSLPPPEGTVLHPARGCEHCGACRRACPTGALSGQGDCLSEITQRKGELPEEAFALMRRYRTVWGCDRCQTACPHTRRAIEAGVITPIGFFHEARLPHLNTAILAAMSPEQFRTRAFAWRGRKTIERNLLHYEGRED